MIYIKDLIHRFRLSKYRYFIKSIIFAFLGILCLLWGFSIIYGNINGCYIAFPFMGIVVCLIFGLRSMVHNCEQHEASKEICPYQKA
ncbi:hypothetical protein GCM10023142_02560 [Anaerocolumna aminovalerica]